MICLWYNKNPLPTAALVWLEPDIPNSNQGSKNNKVNGEEMNLRWVLMKKGPYGPFFLSVATRCALNVLTFSAQ